VVIADNGSTDASRRSAERFKERFSRLRVVDASLRRGTPYAINCGVAAARGRSVLFCDADDVPASGWLAALGNALETHRFVAARMDFEKLNDSSISYRRGFQQQGLDRIAYPPYLYHAGGGSLGVRRDVFQKVGGYDERLVICHETDFCFKVQLTGVAMHFVPDALIQIRCKSDLSSTFRQARLWAEYNILLSKMYRRHGRLKPQGWQRLFRRTRSSVRRILKWQKLSHQNRFSVIWQVGWCLGMWKGVVKHRFPPY
jgi:GT2 family glycosyltransferase